MFTPKKRSSIMAKITSKNTSPEIAVRKALSNHNFKYRLHVKALPGNPDMANKKQKTAVFVNGCFWHQHIGCKRSSIPKSNQDYWVPKLKRNVEKQKIDIKLLNKLGWKTIIVWECETKNPNILERIINKKLWQN
jgi:DNA mismatch endonuclease, patch repair protein